MFTEIVARAASATAGRGSSTDELRRDLAIARAHQARARAGGYTGRFSIAAGRTGTVAMPDITAIVFVVDDDISVRESLELLITSAGWQAEMFASAQDFLSRQRATVPCCLVLDVSLPGVNGLELQQQLAERTEMPIIFITGWGDVPMVPPPGAFSNSNVPFNRSHSGQVLQSALAAKVA